MNNINKASTKFLFAYSNPIQLEGWLLQNPGIKGLCFCGRSNVGKSSLINSLFGKKTAKTSKTPGRTQEIIVFKFYTGEGETLQGPFYLFDLPGYGFAKVSKDMTKKWNELMGTFFEFLPAHIQVINVQDARHPMQKSDLEFKEFIQELPQKKSLIFNKMDKLKKQKEKSALKNQKPKIFKEYKNMRDIHFVSAENKAGIDTLELSLVDFLMLN